MWSERFIGFMEFLDATVVIWVPGPGEVGETTFEIDVSGSPKSFLSQERISIHILFLLMSL